MIYTHTMTHGGMRHTVHGTMADTEWARSVWSLIDGDFEANGGDARARSLEINETTGHQLAGSWVAACGLLAVVTLVAERDCAT